jgi:hypothetical protein
LDENHENHTGYSQFSQWISSGKPQISKNELHQALTIAIILQESAGQQIK